MDDANLNLFAQHYLEIQSLEPALETTAQPSKAEPLFIGWPILLIIGFLLALVGYIWYARHRKLQSIVMSLVGLLIITSMSLGVSHLNQPQSSSIQADGNLTPTNVIIERRDATFIVTWQTAKATTGAVKISSDSSMQSTPTVYTSATPTTLHTVTISNLTASSPYYAQVLSDTIWYDFNGQPIVLSLSD